MNKQIVWFTLILFVLTLGTAKSEEPKNWFDHFSLDGSQNIMLGRHLGIINQHWTWGTPHEEVGEIDGLWAPPYVSHDFGFKLKINGKSVPTTSHQWWPVKAHQQGKMDGIAVDAISFLVRERRAGYVVITLENQSDVEKNISVQVDFRKCTLDYSDEWAFALETSRTPAVPRVEGTTIFFEQGEQAIAVACTDQDWKWNAEKLQGTVSPVLKPGGKKTWYFPISMGKMPGIMGNFRHLSTEPDKVIKDSEAGFADDFADIFQRMPQFDSDNKQLVHLYDRSLMHFFMNQWHVHEFVLDPYFGTGGVRGGCVGNYLWNYGEPWEVMHMYDPKASREHIKTFLGLNLTQHFAFRPTNGLAFGPWYMINQEKIIGQVYYYVKLTGDIEFLSEVFDGRTIMEHMMEHALAKDDPSKPVALIDYGDSNSHLELRKKPNYYNHVMPDLNGRRYANYLMVAALAEEYGKPQPMLVERAEALKILLKEKLWNKETQWFDFINDQGKPEARYTIQMYKLINSPVLDKEEESGLLSHWNENEFLGPFGVHSLALHDIAFDPADVDNGGPGACVCFPPQVAERFYKSGYPEIGEDIIRRMAWLGERMPYWGDSFVASDMNYRHDTPLQCTFDSVTVAQCMIFGMFGIDTRFSGEIAISPHLPKNATTMSLKNIQLRGNVFDIIVEGSSFEVRCQNNQHIRAQAGEVVVLKDGKLVLSSQWPKTEKGYHVY